MLDTKQSWDDLIRTHAPDEETREQILANPLYQNISGRFVQSHDYIAMERLYEIHCEGKYDLIVVDTPPTRNALDFLDAPQRMADFFSSRLLRWLIVPYRSRLVNMASRPFYQVADRILGTQFLADISEFFILFQSMYAGFVERAEAVTRLLSDRRTTFMVVSTLEATPVREAEFFSAELTARKLHLGAVVLNKVLPEYLRDPQADKLAQSMVGRAAELADGLTDDPVVAARVLGEVAESFLNFGVVARREAEQQAELKGAPDVLVTVPFYDADIYDMGGLLAARRAGLGLRAGRSRRPPPRARRLPSCHGQPCRSRGRARVRRRPHHGAAAVPRGGGRLDPGGLRGLGDDGRPPGGPLPRAAGVRRPGHPRSSRSGPSPATRPSPWRPAWRRGAPSSRWRSTPTTP